eukprot:3713760-Amphidinium_carterae.1
MAVVHLSHIALSSLQHSTARPRPGAPIPEAVALVPHVHVHAFCHHRCCTASQQTQHGKPLEQSLHGYQLRTFATLSLYPQPSICEEINHRALRH